MRAARLLPLTLALVLLAGLLSWWPGDGRDRGRPLEAAAVPTAGGRSALSATWYCAAGSADTPSPAEHTVLLTNPDDRRVEARLTAFGAEERAGSEVLELPPASVTPVRVADRFGSDDLAVVVESASGRLAVEHRLVDPDAVDQVPCATSASASWYFPSLTTSQVVAEGGRVERTTAARLVLFNPFPEDAGVDVTAAVEDGLRAPSAWAGVVVPAGTVRVLEVGEHIQRRDQASLSVELRNGRVIAETVQTILDVDGDDRTTSGLRMQPGVPAAASRWGFAAGFTGAGVAERLVVHNPSERPAEVVVQVTPVGGAELPPEPFELRVPGRRFATIDLSAEGRVPGQGVHSIQVETSRRTPVVVARLTEITGPREDAEDAEDAEGAEGDETAEGEDAVEPRPAVGGGTAIGTGSPVVSTSWIVPAVRWGPGEDSVVVIHNPRDGVVRVSARAFGPEGGSERLLDEVEVPARDGLVVRLAGLELFGELGVTLRASSPVLVERVGTFASRDDVAMGLAVPVRLPGGGPLPRLGEL